jgi:hypothetical protein
MAAGASATADAFIAGAGEGGRSLDGGAAGVGATARACAGWFSLGLAYVAIDAIMAQFRSRTAQTPQIQRLSCKARTN